MNFLEPDEANHILFVVRIKFVQFAVCGSCRRWLKIKNVAVDLRKKNDKFPIERWNGNAKNIYIPRIIRTIDFIFVFV